MFDQLKNLDIDRMDLDEAVALLAFGKAVRAEYDSVQVEVPEWVDARIRELKREIHARQADSRDKRLRELKARREALKPAEERRSEIDAEIKRLEELQVS